MKKKPDIIGPLRDRLTKAVAAELLHADEPGRDLVALVLEELAAELRDPPLPLLRTIENA